MINGITQKISQMSDDIGYLMKTLEMGERKMRKIDLKIESVKRELDLSRPKGYVKDTAIF